jgi:hypothetical protein
MDYIQLADVATSVVTDVVQVANVSKDQEVPAWLGGVIGMIIVMVGLTVLWIASEITALYFKKQPLPKKTEAVSKAPVAATAAAPMASMTASGIPFAAIIAAAAQVVQQPLRSVVISAPAVPGTSWVAQGREAIYASHTMKAPHDVSGLSAVKKG